MDAKLVVLLALVLIGITSFVDSKPTCAEPTCGGTLGAPPAEGEGEEEDEDPCMKAGPAWKNMFAWYTYCKDGSIGATKNPIGKIGAPTEEPAADDGAH